MERNEILDGARNAVADRGTSYGDAYENFNNIAKLWSVVLGTDVDADQVALCMTQVKVARLITNPGHDDSWVDIAGYSALGGEVAAKELAAVQSAAVDETTRAIPTPIPSTSILSSYESDDSDVVDDPIIAKGKK